MSFICPTVTAFDINTYNQQLNLVAGFANRVHIDLMDGIFTPTKSPDISEIWIPKDIMVDIHIMYQNPGNVLAKLIELAPSLIILHAESDVDLPYVAAQLRDENIKCGVALLPATTVESIDYILPHVQHSLIFAGKLGYHGGQADIDQLKKVPELKKHNRYLEIGWDGGVNNHNCQLLAQNGVEVLNAGSAIHNAEDPKTSYKYLNHLIMA